ncbi:MAG TPA: restriction endonuclease subunit S [Nitrospiraceae bacterium]|nr:restriction endonuclease subunit S [Nitrospiraceae bacterium]
MEIKKKIPVSWKAYKLGDLANIDKKTLSSRTPKEYRFRYISLSDVNNGVIGSELPEYNFSDAPSRARKCVEKGDVLMATVRPNLQGFCIIRDTVKNLIASTGFAILSPKLKDDSEFIHQYLYSYSISRQINALVVGSNYPAINTDEVRNLSILAPENAAERNKIANILSRWDKAKENIRYLVEAKKKIKHGLMQQLLTGKKRFKKFMGTPAKRETPYGEIPKDWAYPLLKEIAEEVTERNINNREITVLSCTKYDGLVSSQEYFRKRVFSKDTSAYKIVKRSQFAYATNHIEEGSIGLLENFEEGLVSPMYTVFKTRPDAHPPFLFKLFKTELYRHIFEVNTSASVDRRGSLRWKQFSSIHVPLPSFEEQIKISDYIDLYTKEISLLEKQLKLINSQKTGLMQKLLTGQIRVKV